MDRKYTATNMVCMSNKGIPIYLGRKYIAYIWYNDLYVAYLDRT